MTKSRDNPTSGPSRRSKRAQNAWNVESQSPGEAAPSSTSTPYPHFFGRLVCECHRQDLIRLCVTVANQIRRAVGDDTGLARPGAGEDEQRTRAVKDGSALFRVEVFEELHGRDYSTVTLLARFRGWSTSHPRRMAM